MFIYPNEVYNILYSFKIVLELELVLFKNFKYG